MIISPMTEDEIRILVVHWGLAGTIYSTGTMPEDGRPPHPARIRLARMILTWAVAQAEVERANHYAYHGADCRTPSHWTDAGRLRAVLERINWKESPEGKVEP